MITRAAKHSIARNFRVGKTTPVTESEIIALVNYCVRVAGVARVCLRRGKVCNRRQYLARVSCARIMGWKSVPLHACAACQSEYNRRTLDTGSLPRCTLPITAPNAERI